MISSFSPLALLWIPYGVFLGVFVLYSLFCLYHLWRFGVGFGWIAILSSVYIVVSVAMISVSLFWLGTYDWSSSVSWNTLIPSAVLPFHL